MLIFAFAAGVQAGMMIEHRINERKKNLRLLDGD
jgi:hypothetical protein